MALRIGGGVLALVVAWGMQPVSAAIVFEQNFDAFSNSDSLAGTGLTEANSGAGNANYQIANGTLQFTASSTTSNNSGVPTNASAVFQANLRAADLTDPLNPSKAFTISTNFMLDSFVGTGASTVNFGLALFGVNGNFSSASGTNSHYRVLFTPITSSTSDSYRTLSITEISSSGTATPAYSPALTTTQINNMVGQLGTLTVDGYYSGSTLNLQATLSYGSTTISTGLFF